VFGPEEVRWAAGLMRRKGRKRWAAGRKGEGKRFEVLRGLVLFFFQNLFFFSNLSKIQIIFKTFNTSHQQTINTMQPKDDAQALIASKITQNDI
jgi:hypothetical protein